MVVGDPAGQHHPDAALFQLVFFYQQKDNPFKIFLRKGEWQPKALCRGDKTLEIVIQKERLEMNGPKKIKNGVAPDQPDIQGMNPRLLAGHNLIYRKTKRLDHINDVLNIFITFAIMLQKVKQLSQSKSDVLGITSSILCLLHCLAFPVLLSLGYLFSFSAGGHWHVLDYLFVCLGTVAAWASARKTPFPAVKLAFWITVSVFSLSILFHDLWAGMFYLSAGTSVLLIILHSYHWR